jgi:tetratricopeptide (TPR) repeat protein
MSGRRAAILANYLYGGLDLHSRAIEVLHVAQNRGALDESGQRQLINWLENANRYAEMIPLLEPLVATRPDTINYRVQLMVAYQRTSRPQQMQELIQQTDEHFHAGGRWTESNIAQLAYGCFRANEHAHAVKYYDEAIALHQRSHAGLNDGTLSGYYGTLASAHAALGHTKEAVEAASAAIVCWGPRHAQRAQQLNTLDSVISQSKDLDGYVAHLDAEAAKSRQDSPQVRKAVGKAYQSRGQHEKAVAQFKLAQELQPFDKEVHQALIACYDALQQPDNAARQLLQQIDFDRHDLALYQQLAERYKQNEAEAERAATSIIEAAPNEAENHTALAELRQKQERWDEAIPHWQRVAELRKLEPTGLLKLAAAQIQQKQWPAAKETITRLQKGEWPARFNNQQHETLQLQNQLPK